MILVFSIEEDCSTGDVLDWIDHYGRDSFRINNIEDIHVFMERFPVLMIPKDEKQVTAIWYRKMPSWSLPINVFDNPNTDRGIRKYFYSEQNGLFESLCIVFGEKKWLNHWSNSTPNKFYQLLLAEESGLNVPATCIVNCKEQLLDFKTLNRSIIVKPIQDIESIEFEGNHYFQYTNELCPIDIERLRNTFFPGLFQKKIDKNLEIRTFYVENRFYSMAICSSFDKQTKMDFRRYNDSYPNRVVPYQLPYVLEEKLRVFMKKINLNCGSIDLILDNYGDYYFLEVNPVGQFGMVSYPCNYYLEREIATFLIS